MPWRKTAIQCQRVVWMTQVENDRNEVNPYGSYCQSCTNKDYAGKSSRLTLYNRQPEVVDPCKVFCQGDFQESGIRSPVYLWEKDNVNEISAFGKRKEKIMKALLGVA